MPTAKKLPSGSWRCQVYSHTEEIPKADGTIKKKRIYKSFTCEDPSLKGKRKCEADAADWAAQKEHYNHSYDSLTVNDAIRMYIESKEGVLSQSTIRGYRVLLKNNYKEIGNIRLYNIDNTSIQKWITNISTSLNPKSVRNINGLLSAALKVFCPYFQVRTTLPAKQKPDLYVPSDNDIIKLLDHVSGKELEIAILLAAFGPMRRGEICALESDDIAGNVITVRRNMVLGPDKIWYTRQPKTYSGYREIVFPDFVLEKLKDKTGRIIAATPNQITKRFQRAIISVGLPHFRFHDLRHYAASIMHAIGVPDQYIIARGGWSSDSVMKRIYRGVISDENEKQTQIINEHFETMQHEMQHNT